MARSSRIPTFALGLALAAVLAACGGSASPASSPASTATSAKPAGSAAAGSSAGTVAPISAKPAAPTAGAPGAGAASSGVVASAKPAGSPGAAASGARAKLVAGYSVLSPSQVPLWAAAEGGYFANHGLDVEVIKAGAGSVGLAALLSGNLNTLMTSAGSTMNAAVEGADVVYIGSAFDRIVQVMVTKADRTDIKDIKDIKGKKIAVTTPGSLSDLSAHLVAKQAGVDEKDVTLIRLNDIPTIQAAVQNGAVDIGMVDTEPPGGFKIIADLKKFDTPVSNVGFTASRTYYQQHAADFKNFQAAIDEAIKRIKSDQAFTAKVMGQYLKLDDPKAVQGMMADTLPAMKDEMSINKEGIENARQFSAYSIPKLAQFDVTKMLP
jgi:NitT/TauT family transport system substrate-binding protein